MGRGSVFVKNRDEVVRVLYWCIGGLGRGVLLGGCTFACVVELIRLAHPHCASKREWRRRAASGVFGLACEERWHVDRMDSGSQTWIGAYLTTVRRNVLDTCVAKWRIRVLFIRIA